MVGNSGAARAVRRRRTPMLLAASLVFALMAPVPAARAVGDDLDPTFGDDGGRVKGPAGSARALIEVAGKLVVGGCTYAVSSGCSALVVSRYSENGVLDTEFGDSGRVTTELGESDGVHAIVAQADKLVAVGSAVVPGNPADFVLVRYDSAGHLDPSFGPPGSGGIVRTDFGGTDDKAFAVVVSGDNLVVAGSSGRDFALARYDGNGILDNSFGGSGNGKVKTSFGGTSGGVRALALQGPKLIAAGSGGGVAGRSDFALARYDGNGILDTSFGVNGTVTTEFGEVDQGRALVVQSDGIVVAGVTDPQLTTPPLVALARYGINGAPDPLFGVSGQATGPSGVGSSLVVVDQGKIVVAGRSSTENSENSDAVLARFNSNGSLDPTFGTGGVVLTDFGAADDQAAAAVLQGGSQKVVVAGHSGGLGSNGFNIALARYETAAGTEIADIGVALTDTPDPVAVGGEITYSATVANVGPGSAAQGRLVAPAPSGAELVSARSSQGACTLQSVPGVEIEAVCNLGVVAAGQSVAVTLVGRTTTEGTATATVVVGTSSADTNPLNNTAVTTTTVGPAAGEWDATTPMSDGRTFHTATLLSGGRCAAASPPVCGQVLVVGGQGLSASGVLSSAELFDPAGGTWNKTDAMGAARFKHTATLLSDGRVLVAGGGSSNTMALASSEIYDPGTGTWSNVASASGARLSHAASRLLDGRVLVQGGYAEGSGGARLGTAQTFDPDPVPGTWAAVAATMAEGRALHSSTLLVPTGEVLVVGGFKGDQFSGGNPAAAPEVFVPSTGAWRATGDNAIHRWNNTATDLQDGRVLLAGGETNPNGVIPTPSVELYDPLAIDVTGSVGSWRSVRSLASARTSHTATRLAGGQVLVTGGREREESGTSATLASAELYDPVRNRWSSAGLMTVERYSHTATLLGPDHCGANCGKVLVVGGSGVSAASPSSAELYTPAPAPAVTGISPDRGPSAGGTHVVVTGSGFDGADTVRFGAVEAAFEVDSPGRITATSPAVPGGTLVDVTVSGPAGTSSAVPSSRFTYEFSPPGSVGELVASAESETAILLSFTAPGGDGPFAPAARRYRIKQSLAPLGDAAAFANAPLLCECDIDPPPEVRDAISLSVGDLVAGTTYHYAVQALNEAGQAGPISNSASATTFGNAPQPGPPARGLTTGGYRLVAADGGIFAFGNARFLGSTGAIRLNRPIVGMASTPSGNGYRLVAADGGIFAFGDARFLGSTGAIRLNRPVVGMASTPSGNGYWLVAEDGGIFAFGDARFLGSTGAIRLNRPVVGMASTPSGNGYWLVAADGGVFAFGDARFVGSTGAIRLNRPIVGIATATPRQGANAAGGYWLVAEDGGIFAFGDARFLGSTGAIRLARPVVGMATTPSGSGYRLVGADGGVFAFGDAAFLGSTGGLRLNAPVVGMAGGR